MEDFKKQVSGDVLIEKVNLQRVSRNEAKIMKSRIFEDILLNNKKIIIDISKCDLIDNSFLGALVASLKRTIEAGGDIKIVIASSSSAKGIVNNSGILAVFEIYTSVKDAISSFRQNGEEPQIEFTNHIYYLCKKYDYKN
jgi:anti-anti-sigma regulatory factor